MIKYSLNILLVVLASLASADVKLDTPSFIHLGNFDWSSIKTKQYYISRNFWVDATQARSICKTYDMDIVSLDDQKEYDDFMNILCPANSHLWSTQTYIGLVTTLGGSKDKWFWDRSNSLVGYPLDFMPNEPNNKGNREWCLALVKDGNKYGFNDIPCDNYVERFICQKMVNGTN